MTQIEEMQSLSEKAAVLKNNLITYKAQSRAGALKQSHLIKETRRELARTLHALQHEEFMHAFSTWLSDMEAQCNTQECAIEA